MKHLLLVVLTTAAVAACNDTTGPDPASNEMSFFVSSTGHATGNLGGLTAADQRCQQLAAAVGFGSRTWRAYLSVERDPANNNQPIHARDRIGTGPWHNAGNVLVASNVTDLHARAGDANLFLDERGQRVNGQWSGSPSPNEHDILTGSNADGTVATGKTCGDWTSASNSLAAVVGHADGLGPNQNGTPPLNSWNAAHDNQDCSNTAPRGGAGRIYCFAR
jgi:hypothetical protein